jgi:DNA-binding NarL/FixJ family response regulator
MEHLRVLLVDDNLSFLNSAVELLSTYDELEVVGCATSAGEALERIADLHPDLVMVDLVMPQIDGLAATRLIKSRPQAPRVIVWSLHTDRQYRVAAIEVGADGFLAKSGLTRELLPLIHRLFDSGVV